MKAFYLCVVGLLLFSCYDSRETRLQRFLLQGNNMVTQQSYQEAKHYYQEALKLDSCFAEAWNNLGTVYYKEKNYGDAIRCYNNALDCRPGYYDVYLNRSNTYYELNELKPALYDLDTYKKNRPDTSVWFFSRALISAKMRRYDDAVASFLEAWRMDSLNAEIPVNLGTVYYYKKEYDSARKTLRTALKLKPDEPNAFNTFALIESESGNYDEAMRWINKALEILPDDPYFLNNRGYFYLLKDDLTKAVSDIDKSIGEDPYNAWAYRNKGIYFLRVNDSESAIRLLSRAEKIDRSIDKIYLYLGEAYLKKGERSKACESYKQALGRQEITEAQYKKICSR